VSNAPVLDYWVDFLHETFKDGRIFKQFIDEQRSVT